jgi:CubicO group peptidase (beta-lactamase class C family)
MKKMILSLLLIGLVAVLLSAAPEDNLPASVLRKVERLVEKEAKSLENGGIVLALGSAKGPAWSAQSGWTDKELGAAIDADSMLLIASVTKLFTATAIMQLAERGLVDLETPLEEYLPEFSINGASPEDTTLGGILTHHTALPANILKGYLSPWDGTGSQMDYIEEYLDLLSGEYMPATGPEVYRYSNVGYELAAAVVSKVSGMEFYEYVDRTILSPLGMENSTLDRRGPAADVEGYTGGKKSPALSTRGTGEGDLISTANDLLKFASAFLAGGRSEEARILKAASVERMFARHNGSVPLDFDLHRGYGWYSMDVPGYPGVRCFYHDGGTDPFSSTLMIIPEYDISLSAIANEDEKALDGLSIKVIQLLLAEKTGKRAVEGSSRTAGRPRSPALDPGYYGFYATELGLMQITPGGLYPGLNMMGMDLSVVRLFGERYGIRLKLLGFISLPIADLKAIGVSFREIGGQAVFAIYDNGKFRGIGTRFEPAEIHPAWLERVGSYRVLNPDPIPFMESFALIVDDETGIPMVSIKVASVSSVFNLPIDLSNPDYGVVLGQGRHMGDRIRVSETGEGEVLKYSGHELRLEIPRE